MESNWRWNVAERGFADSIETKVARLLGWPGIQTHLRQVRLSTGGYATFRARIATTSSVLTWTNNLPVATSWTVLEALGQIEPDHV